MEEFPPNDVSNTDASKKVSTETFFSKTVVSVYADSDEEPSNKTDVSASKNGGSNKNDISLGNSVSNKNDTSSDNSVSNKNDTSSDNSVSNKNDDSAGKNGGSNNKVERDEWTLSNLQIFNLNAEENRWQTVPQNNVKMTLKKSETFELDFIKMSGTDVGGCLFNLNLESVPIILIFGPEEAFIRWGPTPPG
jgi:hypothetical protein